MLAFALVFLTACSGGETVLGNRDGEFDADDGDDVADPDDAADLTDDQVDAEAEAEVCVPDCEGRCGGDDSCGGTCPPGCGEGEVCVTPPGECATARGWVEVLGTSPPRRGASAMAYDSARGVAVLFGGEDHGALGDTWEYDGATWTQVTTPTSPPARGEHQMVYDSTRDVVVMFGGWCGCGVTGYLEDTWEYDGTTWTEVEAPAPLEHMNGSCYTMAYDPVRGVLVMACADRCDLGSCGWHIHEYDGATWTEPGAGHGARDARVGYFDSARGVVVFLGSDREEGVVVRRWEYDGTTLTETDTTTTWPPGGTIPPGMGGIPEAYDPGRDTVVLFGGMIEGAAAPMADTWEYDGASWAEVETATTPAARVYQAMTYDSDRGVVVMFGGHGVAGSLGDTWEYLGP